LEHLDSNAAVCVACGKNYAILPHGSKVKADLQLCVYHKLLRCKKQAISHQLRESNQDILKLDGSVQ